MRKVVFLTPRYLPHLGGVEVHLHHVSSYLLQKGYSVMVITEQHDQNLPEHEVIDGVEVWRIPVHESYPGRPSKLSLWKWLQKNTSLLNQADIIHVHDVFFWLLPFPMLLLKKKIFMTFHGYEAPGPPSVKQIFWHQLAELLSQGNIAIGHFHQKWYGIEPDSISYGGVDLDKIHNRTKEKYPSQKTHAQRYIFIGRLDKDTGITQYLEAMQTLQQRSQKYSLDVFGDGPLKKMTEKFVAEHHLPVTFHGFVSHPEQYLQRYDFALVSQYLSILNGLAAGVPVIAFADQPIKTDYLEMTPFCRWLRIAHSPAQIADVLSPPLNQRENTQRIKAARQWAQQQTWERLSESYIKLWQER